MVTGVRDNQDFVGANGIAILRGMIIEPHHDTKERELQNAALVCLKSICMRHEGNKSTLSKMGLPAFIPLLQTHREAAAAKDVADVLRVLTIHDDPYE